MLARWDGPWWTGCICRVGPCEAAGVPEDKRRSEMVGRAQERGHLKAGWVAAETPSGCPVIPRRPGGLGDVVRAGPVRLYGWPPEPAWTNVEFGDRASPQAEAPQRAAADNAGSDECRSGMSSRWPREARDHAATCSPRGCVKPGEIGPFTAGFGSEPRYYLSNAPEDTPLETLAYVGGSRAYRNGVRDGEKRRGAGRYETGGWHHHVALCLLGGAFLLSLQQALGEKDAPDHEAAGLPGGAGDAAPGTVRT